MYRVIFEHHPKKDQEGAFIEQWQKGSDIIQTYPGARGTKLFRDKNKPEVLYAMAEWESKEVRSQAVDKIKEREDADFILHKHIKYVDSHETILELDCIAESNPLENNFPKLGPMIIGTINIEKAKEFYISVFSITVENQNDHYVSARLPDGTHIELEEDSENRFPNWAKHNIGTYKNTEFFVEDIDSFLGVVEQYGGKIISTPIVRPWGGFAAEFADPDGNTFLISQK